MSGSTLLPLRGNWAGEIGESNFESMVEAFADADGGEQAVIDHIGNAGHTLPEGPYRDLPEGSKYWYRVRMKAALAHVGFAVVPDPTDP